MRYLLLLLASGCFLGVCSASAALRGDARLVSDWRFNQGEASGAEQPAFNDHDWQTVSLPHNWGWEQAQKGEAYLRGPGWYRRDLNIGRPAAGRRYFLRFGAAGSVANVYLNGKSLGEHRGAFGAFCFEITRQLSSSGTNLLAVRVSNAAEPDIAPISGDFCVFGGLYRAVDLIETDETCFALTDHASPGVAWLQSSVTRDQAVLEVTAQISSGVGTKRPMTFVARVLDDQGREAGAAQQEITLMPHVTAPFAARIVIANPHLWNGRKDPYLYRAVVELRTAEGVRVGVSVAELEKRNGKPFLLFFYHAEILADEFFAEGLKHRLQKIQQRNSGEHELVQLGAIIIDGRQRREQHNMIFAYRDMLGAQAGELEGDFGAGRTAEDFVGEGVFRRRMTNHLKA